MEQPLDINLDLSQTKTAVPLIADGTMVRLRLKSISQVPGEKGKQLKFEYNTTAPVPNSEGGVINPGDFGSTVFENIALYAKPDAKDPKWFEKRIATRVDALLGTGDVGNTKEKPTRPAFNGQLVPTLIGKELIAKMRVRTGDYVGNEIASVTFPGDIAEA